MNIRIGGAGIYGLHLASALIADGHKVEVWEASDRVFAGASGANPARMHVGVHYPRSKPTREHCQEDCAAFMRVYGAFTRAVPINIYAVAAKDSLVDFGTYLDVLRGSVEFISIHNPKEFGLYNVEGAVLTGERHIATGALADRFARDLSGVIKFKHRAEVVDDPSWDLMLDCTYCGLTDENVDRWEPCVMGLMEGPVDRSTTIMDGPFGGLYVFDETENLSSLTSAKLTPFARCKSRAEAEAILAQVDSSRARARCLEMLNDLSHFWPEVKRLYRLVDYRLSIRAMPRSAADMRTVDIRRVGERSWRVMSGKMTNIFDAERQIKEIVGRM